MHLKRFWFLFVSISQVCSSSTTNSESKTRGLIEIRNGSKGEEDEEFSSTSSTTEMILHANVPKCDNSDEIELYRNLNNCSEYFMACVRPSPANQASSNYFPLSTLPSALKEQYNIQSKSCSDGYLFDLIEKTCLLAEYVSCNDTFETICNNGNFLHKDPIRLFIFIECLNDTAMRQECQPKGTVFNEFSQVCEKLPKSHDEHSEKTEKFSLKLLRFLAWIVSSTNDKFSPWMERVKLSSSDQTKNSSSTITDYLDEDASNSSDYGGRNFSLIFHPSGNQSLIQSKDYDEVLLLSNETGYLILYYGVMVGGAMLLILSWILVAILCNKASSLCNDESYDEDDQEEFYRYNQNQNDKYVMTRL